MGEKHLLFVVAKILAVFLCLELSGDCAEVVYISPTSCPVPSNPCLSLNGLAANTSWLNHESNTTLIFSPGIHLLSIELSISSINNLSLFPQSLKESQSTIVCQQNASFNYYNITHVLIRGLKFVGCESSVESVEEFVIETSTFHGQNDSGTALEVRQSNVSIINSSFVLNTVGSCLTSPTELSDHSQFLVGGAIFAQNSSNITIVKSTFEKNRAEIGGAIFATFGSCIRIINSTFIDNLAARAINSTKQSHCHDDNALYGSYLSQNNVVVDTRFTQGGAIALTLSSLFVNSSIFGNNGNIDGGAGVLILQNESLAKIYNTKFYGSHAARFGGVLNVVDRSHVIIDNCTIRNSSSQQGGVVDLVNSYLTIRNSILSNNTATTTTGGVIAADQYSYLNVTSSQFINNKAPSGGVLSALNTKVYINGSKTLFLRNQARDNGGVMSISQSQLNFDGSCVFKSNLASNGGAIYAIETTVSINNELSVISNVAEENGGGLYLYRSRLNCNYGSRVNVSSNRANFSGGGIFTVNSLITVFENRTSLQQNRSSVKFFENSAQKGGGIYLMSASQLRIYKTGERLIDNNSNVLYFDSNSAEYGEAIYVSDETYYDVCSRPMHSSSVSASTECFIQVISPQTTFYHRYDLRSIHFAQSNSFNEASVIYGGLLDRCTLDSYAEVNTKTKSHGNSVDGTTYLKLISNINDTHSITSEPVRLCFCTPNNQRDCGYTPPDIKVNKGETFNVSLVAVDQVNYTLNNVIIHCSISNTKNGLGYGQITQRTTNACTNLNFTISSLNSYEELILYAEGPCRNVNRSQSRLRVVFKPCTCLTIGFQAKDRRSDAITCECVCDSRLYPYFGTAENDCNYQTGLLSKHENFWIAFVNMESDDKNSSGFIIYPHCPLDYCHSTNAFVNLDKYNGSDDSQCANKRSGTLCGSCLSGHSLSLGSSRCFRCSKAWYKWLFLALLVVALVAGVAIVILLMALNLTVATGTLNGLIFYANTLGADRGTIIPSSTKIPSTFISWLNLDIGLDTCFFEGMDTYWKMWIKLAFPSYVILLVVLIIIVSNHSIKFSRLLARRDPVAALATLILLSYTMYLRTTIAVLSFAKLNYPDGSIKWVWLHDGTVEYVRGRHVALFIVALFILVIGIIYTSILFFWQWILHHQDRVTLRWARYQKLHHFIAPYHAPYKTNKRYWMGLLLFARIVLYLVFALNVSGDPDVNLLAIAVIVSALLFLRAYVGKIYRNKIIDTVEMTCYFNAVLFSAVELYLLKNGIQSDLAIDITAYTSAGITFILFFAILSYHIWIVCGVKCFKTCTKQRREQTPLQDDNQGNLANYPPNDNNNVATPTFSVIEGPKDRKHTRSTEVGQGQRSSYHPINASDDDNMSVASIESDVPLLDELLH